MMKTLKALGLIFMLAALCGTAHAEQPTVTQKVIVYNTLKTTHRDIDYTTVGLWNLAYSWGNHAAYNYLTSAKLSAGTQLIPNLTGPVSVSGVLTGSTLAGTSITLESTNAGATGTRFDAYHNSASPAVSDILFQQKFYGNDSGANKTEFGSVKMTTTNVTDAFEAADLVIASDVGSASTIHLTPGSGGVVTIGGGGLTVSPGNTTLGSTTINGAAPYLAGGTDVPVADGGTGASTASGARTNLGVGTGDSPTLTGLTLSGLTATAVPYLNGSKALTSSAITPTELGYLSGASSNLQTQINVLSGGGMTSLTGDVTGTGPGATAATIANDAVTLAKMANMATASILGRSTAGTGDPEVLSASSARGVLGLGTTDSPTFAELFATTGTFTSPTDGDGLASPQIRLRANGTDYYDIFAETHTGLGNIPRVSLRPARHGDPSVLQLIPNWVTGDTADYEGGTLEVFGTDYRRDSANYYVSTFAYDGAGHNLLINSKQNGSPHGSGGVPECIFTFQDYYKGASIGLNSTTINPANASANDIIFDIRPYSTAFGGGTPSFGGSNDKRAFSVDKEGDITFHDATTSGSLSVAGTTQQTGNLTYTPATATSVAGFNGSKVLSSITDLPTATTIGSAYVYRASGTDVPVLDGGTGSSTAGGAATNLGLGTGDSPTFTGVTVSGATASSLAGFNGSKALGTITDIPTADTIGGSYIYRAAGTDVPVTDGGTGSSTAGGAATNLGLGTGNTPVFTGVNLSGNSASTLPTTDGSKNLISTEIGYSASNLNWVAAGSQPIFTISSVDPGLCGVIQFKNKRGSSTLNSGDYLFYQSGLIWDSTSATYGGGVAIASFADGSPSNTSKPGRLEFQTATSGGTSLSTKLKIGNDGTSTFTGNIVLGTAGNGVQIKTGTNATAGTATLIGGTIVVSTTKTTASSIIELTGQNSSGTHGELTVSARTAGTSFTISSSNASDTRLVGWVIIEPAP